MKKNVALIYGGRGFERDVSVLGADFVLPNFNKEKYNLIPIFIHPDGRWLISFDEFEFHRPDRAPKSECVGLINRGGRGGFFAGSKFISIDAAFPLLHGDFGEDGVVQGALANAGIPYVGENVSVSALCLDKALTHRVADGLLVPGTRWLLFPCGTDCEAAREMVEVGIGYPCFIKPVALGSSVGIGEAADPSSFLAVFNKAASFGDGRVVVERKIELECELEIGVLRHKGNYLFTKVGKISAASGFYDYDEKYSAKSETVVDPSPTIDEKIEKTILAYAQTLAEGFNIRSLCRIDFFLDREGLIYFNEINTMPGFTEKSLYPTLCEKSGIPIKELLEILVEGAEV